MWLCVLFVFVCLFFCCCVFVSAGVCFLCVFVSLCFIDVLLLMCVVLRCHFCLICVVVVCV